MPSKFAAKEYLKYGFPAPVRLLGSCLAQLGLVLNSAPHMTSVLDCALALLLVLQHDNNDTDDDDDDDYYCNSTNKHNNKCSSDKTDKN